MPRGRAVMALESSDADLATRAAGGDSAAFEELYRRHSPAAWRVAQAVSHNADDASDAVSEAFTKVFQALPKGRLTDGGAGFRPYLMTATRNCAIDGLRRRGRTQPESPDDLDGPSGDVGPTEAALAGADADLVTHAFRSLPERWRTVLWLTEVEALGPRDAAETMGLTPNGVSQLAVRARAGLRERYLQAHLQGRVAKSCEPTHGLLGAYAAGALSPRDIAKVDQHLAGCESCRARVAELEDLGSTLRRIALPFPIALATIAGAKLAAMTAAAAAAPASGSASAAAGGAGSALSTSSAAASDLMRRWQRPLFVAAVSTLALGIMAATVVQQDQVTQPRLGGRPAPSITSPSPATVTEEQAALINLALESRSRPDGGAQISEAPSPQGPQPADPQPTAPKPKPPAPTPVVNLSANTPVAGVSLGGGDGACTGGQVGGTPGGCPPPELKDGETVALITEGSLLGHHELRL